MKRGEVWWASIPEPSGRRPVVLLSRDAAYALKSSVTVAEISRTIRGIPSEVPLGKARRSAAILRRKCRQPGDDPQTVA